MSIPSFQINKKAKRNRPSHKPLKYSINIIAYKILLQIDIVCMQLCGTEEDREKVMSLIPRNVLYKGMSTLKNITLNDFLAKMDGNPP